MAHERRVFFSTSLDEPLVGKEVPLSRDISHHLTTVLRLTVGDTITAVLQPSGAEFEAILVTDSIPTVIKLVSQIGSQALFPRVKSLLCALPKGKKADEICEKATELGAQNIVFWRAQRSIPQFKTPEDVLAKVARWAKIAESAARQSQQRFVPVIKYKNSLSELMDSLMPMRNAGERYLVCSLSPGATPYRDIRPPSAKSQIHIIVGPEGDLSPGEESSLNSFGFEPVSLGPSTLRTETAALVAVALAQEMWGWINQDK